MVPHDIIVIGASAGGLDALKQIVKELPKDIPAAIFIVMHISPSSPDVLHTILNSEGGLPVTSAVNGEVIQHGHIYVAPPDHHLLLEKTTIRLSHGPKENMHRPAIDPLFRSAAYADGPRVIGVLLSGPIDDGTVGLLVVKSCGGIAVVQDPKDAVYPTMPRSALENIEVDYSVPVSRIASLLGELANIPVEKNTGHHVPEKAMIESGIEEMKKNSPQDMAELGKPSTFTCPECNGTLWEIREGKLFRFRCRVGHAYSPVSMVEEQSEKAETSLWIAMRSLEENAELYRRMAAKEREMNNTMLANRFEERAKDVEHHVGTIRQILMKAEKPKVELKREIR